MTIESRVSCLLVLGLAGLLGSRLPAQDADVSPAPASLSRIQLPAPSLRLPNNVQPDLITPVVSDTYRIGVNDLIAVFVYQMPELTRQVRVNSRGNIRLPFLSGPIHAAGLTTSRVQEKIAQAYLRAEIVTQPVIQVAVREVKSKPIIVTGAVNAPQVIQASHPLTLLEVLSRAGGLSSASGNTALVVHQSQGRQITKFYNLAQLLQDNNPADNPTLTGHDSVTVLPQRYVYVVGSFKRPGAFPLHTGQPITVVEAVALAEGLRGTPKKSAAVIIHTETTGAGPRQTAINLNRILHRRAPDLQLQAGDILYVPTDERRKVMITALQDAAQVLTLGIAYHFPALP